MPPELRLKANAFSGARALKTESRTFTSGDFSVQMADEAVHFRMEEDGRLFARMADNPDEKEYALTASVEGLRYKLAEDMFSHPDLFDRKELKDMLPVPTKRENRQQQLSTGGTYERHVFMLAIKSRSNIGGASLENVTTANLRDLAQAALDTDGDADAVTEELKKRQAASAQFHRLHERRAQAECPGDGQPG